MIRLCFSVGGVCLLLLTVVLSVVRRAEVDDSLSFLLITQDRQSSEILRVKLNGQSSELFTAPAGAQVLNTDWSLDGQKLLITLIYLNHPTLASEVYIIDVAHKSTRWLYGTDEFVQNALFSPNGDEFVLTRWLDGNPSKQHVDVIRADLHGNELQRYNFAGSNHGNGWNLEWSTPEKILLHNLTENKMYQINTSTHEIIATEEPFNLQLIHFPDGDWQTIFVWGEHYIEKQRIDAPDTRVKIVELPNEHIVDYRFANDNQWLGIASLQSSLTNVYFAPADIYRVKYDGTHLEKLVEDDKFKSFLPFDTGEPSYFRGIKTSFSPQDKWLVFYSLTQNPFGFYVHAVRVDNPHRIQSNLYTSNDVTRNTYVLWEPSNADYETPFHPAVLFVAGIIVLGLGLRGRKRQGV